MGRRTIILFGCIFLFFLGVVLSQRLKHRHISVWFKNEMQKPIRIDVTAKNKGNFSTQTTFVPINQSDGVTFRVSGAWPDSISILEDQSTEFVFERSEYEPWIVNGVSSFIVMRDGTIVVDKGR